MRPRIPLAQKPIAYIDTETTGLDPSQCEILELSIVFDTDKIQHLLEGEWKHFGLIVVGDYTHFTTKIKPQHIERASPKALEINGYAANPHLWENAPTFSDIAITVSMLLRDVLICGHNVSFDEAFLNQEFRNAGSEFKISYHKIDTVTLAFVLLLPLGLEYVSLDAVRKFLGWSTDNAHTALVDALDARRLLKHAQGMLVRNAG